MEKESRFIIYKKYPKDWEKMNIKEKIKKGLEFSIVSFIINNYSPIRDFFEDTDNLCVEFNEGPDFFLYPNEVNSKILGLEITDCYVNSGKNYNRNILSVHSDLEKICGEVIKEVCSDDLRQKINYLRVVFTHDIMVGCSFDKMELKSELKDSILHNNKNCNRKYVCRTEAGYSPVYPEDKIKLLLNSNKMYFIPHINDVVQFQKEIGVDDYDPVQLSISLKEDKLVDYKQNCKYIVDKWWLCINVPYSSFMNPISYHLPDAFTSKYDRILLVSESYGYNIHLIYEL